MFILNTTLLSNFINTPHHHQVSRRAQGCMSLPIQQRDDHYNIFGNEHQSHCIATHANYQESRDTLQTEPPIFHALVYISWATQLMQAADLDRILLKARENNFQAGITGILLYRNGIFMQYIEGYRDTLQVLLEKLRHDPRHEDLTVMDFSPIDQRYFPAWEMQTGDFEYLGHLNLSETGNNPLKMVRAFVRDFSAGNKTL
jgi:Sensors of blue-light using FAD